MKLDFLFTREDPGSSARERREPRMAGLPGFSRAMLPARVTEPEEAPIAPSRRGDGAIHDPRRMSPRQLADWAHDMYLSGALDWHEYRLAGFPAELHPDYNQTVGALTGQPAHPDGPRDMVQEWEERLAFTRRHSTPLGAEVRLTEKVVTLLRRQSETPGRQRA